MGDESLFEATLRQGIGRHVSLWTFDGGQPWEGRLLSINEGVAWVELIHLEPPGTAVIRVDCITAFKIGKED